MTQPPSNPTGPLSNRLAELRKGLTGKLQAAAEEAGQSALGAVAAGLARQATGELVSEAPAPAVLEGVDAEAAEATRVADEVARKQEAAAAASRKRMAFIVAYVKDPASNPIFAEKATVFQVLTEERTHQVGLIQDAEGELSRMPPPPAELGMTPEEVAADERLVAQEARRAELGKRLKQAKAVQTQIFNLLKAITGIKGETGGEDFVPTPEVPETTEETSTEDAFGAAAELLARMKKKP